MSSVVDAAAPRTIRAIAETFAPPGSDIERVAQNILEAFEALPALRRANAYRFLNLLDGPWINAIFAGRFKSFADLTDAQRQAMMVRLSGAPLVDLRAGFAAVKRLALFFSYALTDEGGYNPLWRRIKYGGPFAFGPAQRAPAIEVSIPQAGELLNADVVVIGSGAGGGVAAQHFALRGRKVIVIDAGPAWFSADVTQREFSMRDTYLDRGLAASDDLGISILAGSCLGGGTTINWSTSFRLPRTIAGEWDTASGVGLLSAELLPEYEILTQQLGLATSPHNTNNAVLVRGCERLGIPSGSMPRNAQGCGDGCGYCGYGCAYGNKRSTAVMCLPDVLANAGQVYAKTRATRIRFAGKRAYGVDCEYDSPQGARKFQIDANLIVCAAGALRTPGILAASGIKHPLLGKRLFLHPTTSIAARFAQAIESWKGPMQTAYSDAYNYVDGTNYGAKLEVSPTHPGLAASALPWRSRDDHANLMQDVAQSASLVALVRDQDPGSVSLASGAVEYRLSARDAKHLMKGLIGMIDVAFAGGAQSITTLHTAGITISKPEWLTERARFVNRFRAIGTKPHRLALFSAHQMGTACMGGDARASVVDPTGAVWGYEGLIVADASTFPLASGVNPMLTIMAMARRIAAQH